MWGAFQSSRVREPGPRNFKLCGGKSGGRARMRGSRKTRVKVKDESAGCGGPVNGRSGTQPPNLDFILVVNASKPWIHSTGMGDLENTNVY